MRLITTTTTLASELMMFKINMVMYGGAFEELVQMYNSRSLPQVLSGLRRVGYIRMVSMLNDK